MRALAEREAIRRLATDIPAIWAAPTTTDADRKEILRQIIERSFAWMTRFRRLARDYERLQTTLEGMHYLAFAILLLQKAEPLLAQSA